MKLSIKKYSWVFLEKLEKEIQKQAHKASGLILDIGCGEKPYLQFFNKNSSQYVGIDLPFSMLANDGSVDVFADALKLPFKSETFDTILCFEVLDDIPEPSDIFKEINQSMKTGGILFLSVPQMWNVHNAPYDFYRYTRHGLAYQAEKHGFEVVSIIGVGGFWARMAAKMFRFIYRFGLNSILKSIIGVIIIPFQLFFHILDSVLFSKDDVICNLMIAKKVKPVPSQA